MSPSDMGKGAARVHPLSESHILNIATAAFLERGYGLASMDDIAHECNMTPDALRQKFATKETLFRLIMDKETLAAREPILGPIPMFDTAMEAIQFVAGRQKEIMHGTLMAPLSRIICQESQRHPEIRDMLLTPDGEEQSQAMGEHIFAKWIEHGLFRECNVGFAIRKLYGMLNQAFLLERAALGKDIDGLDDYLQSVCDTFCREYGVT